jgi:hypothetical protein
MIQAQTILINRNQNYQIPARLPVFSLGTQYCIRNFKPGEPGGWRGFFTGRGIFRFSHSETPNGLSPSHSSSCVFFLLCS